MKQKGIKWIYTFIDKLIYPNKTRSATILSFLLALLKHVRLIVIVR